MRYFKIILLAALLITGRERVAAQTTAGITSAVPFLRIAPDARAGAMANMGIATSADAYSTFYNTSKTIFSGSKMEFGATYTPWLRNVTNDMYLATLSGYYKLDDNQAITMASRYFNMGDVTNTDYNGTKQDNFKPVEYALDAGYVRKLSDRFSVGVAFKYIHSKIGTQITNGVAYSAGNAFAGDISATYNGLSSTGEGWTVGAALSNMGSKVGYTNNGDHYFLPANLGIGATYTGMIDEENKITVGGEINKSLVPAVPSNATDQDMIDYYNTSIITSWGKSFSNNAMALGIGGEYTYSNLLNLRAGYNFETKNMGGRNYLTVGAGLHYEGMKFDFAYLATNNLNPLANTMRFSIAVLPLAIKKSKK